MSQRTHRRPHCDSAVWSMWCMSGKPHFGTGRSTSLCLARRRMDNPFEYHPELGLYYHEVAPGLLCGTQLRSAADVERLAGAFLFVSVTVAWLWLLQSQSMV